jgi:hypothetical protein
MAALYHYREGIMMSFLRGFPIAALALGLVAMPSAAFASTSQHTTGQRAAVTVSAAPSTPASRDAVRKVRCTEQTFNVYHGHPATPTCYAGTGTKTPRTGAVSKITTGQYWGCLKVLTGNTLAFGSFHPEELINFQRSVELVSFKLARHQIACPK